MATNGRTEHSGRGVAVVEIVASGKACESDSGETRIPQLSKKLSIYVYPSLGETAGNLIHISDPNAWRTQLNRRISWSIN
jgi:hypothetical protein